MPFLLPIYSFYMYFNTAVTVVSGGGSQTRKSSEKESGCHLACARVGQGEWMGLALPKKAGAGQGRSKVEGQD